jgi:hypothetical protein
VAWKLKTGPIDPQHWQQYDIVESRAEKGWRLVPNADASRYSDSLYSEVYYFVGSAELDHLYPAAASPGTIQSPLISESAGALRRDPRGRKSKIEWDKVVAEAAYLMKHQKYRNLADLVKAICAHLPELSDVDARTVERHLTHPFRRLGD